jgi:hypothetical protein
MNESTELIDEKYRQVFEEEMVGLERRRANDPSCTIEDLSGTLHHLYIMEGNDWTGRGQVQDAALSATIAAYEHFIAEWKKESAT